jgi:hypothetical protein
MKQNCQRIAICGLVRDCKQALVRNWQALRNLESEITKISWVFVENDSVDGSREWLDELACNHPNVTVIGENLGEPTIPTNSSSQVMPGFSIQRISKMAFFRNLYLDHVKQKIGLDNLEAVIVVDYDVYSLPVDHLKKCLEHLKPGEVITALGVLYRPLFINHFYDCYAYRSLENNSPQTYPEIDSQRRDLWRKFRSETSSVLLDSNFNGCAVYHAATFANSKYIVLTNDDPQIECYVEHVGLHSLMKAEGTQIWLDPRLKVFYNTAFTFWWHKIYRFLLKLIR